MTEPDPDAWGIVGGHRDTAGRWVPARPEAVHAALSAMGADDGAPTAPSTWVVRRGQRVSLPRPARLEADDGSFQDVAGSFTAETLGYHWIDFGSNRVRLIVGPGRCPAPLSRAWGWALQLYALRSTVSWGMGDLGDLRRFAMWARSVGADLVLLNPLAAAPPAAPAGPAQPSPYFPSSRRWRNPAYLELAAVPGFAAVSGLDAVGVGARALNHGDRIDRDAVWRLKRLALERVWRCTTPGRDFARWRQERGPALERFATFCALGDEFGPDWRTWPASYQAPSAPEVAHFALAAADRVAFHAWLQWLVDRQLAVAAEATELVGDLPVGSDPGGADAWEWQHVLAASVSIGAPPDDFNPDGQDWGLPPFDPWRLRAAHYEPFVELIRAALEHHRGLRVDHVMGWFRLYWIPAGNEATDGVYVRYPWADLCQIVALEAMRAGAFVVGEDLGTVEPETRAALADAGVLSTRVLWFEPEPPVHWPEDALALVTTHDLPTVAGVWTGSEVEASRRAGLRADVEPLRRKLAGLGGLGPVSGVVACAYRALAESPCALAAVALDDALEVQERPNMPGTTTEWPNWCVPLPMSLEELLSDERLLALAAVMQRGRQRSPAPGPDKESGLP